MAWAWLLRWLVVGLLGGGGVGGGGGGVVVGGALLVSPGRTPL